MKATIVFLFAAVSLSADTTVLFQPSMSVGPFPTDALTAANPSQKTGRQVNLPLPSNCGNPALSACTDALLLNQLDGFSVNPMVVVCFSGPIDPNSLAKGIQIFPLSNFGASIGINQILVDPQTNCMFAKPNQVLAQQSRYLLTVSDRVHEYHGGKVDASAEFNACLQGRTHYCKDLSDTLGQFDGEFEGEVVAASVFTTMSATDWVEKAHDFVNDPSQPVAQLPASNPTVFSLSSNTTITWIPQDNQKTPSPQPIPVSALAGVDKVAFGLFLTRNFINTSGPLAGTITVTPTGLPIDSGPNTVGTEPVSFHVFLPPQSKMPPGGFPVVIYGHGLGDNQFGAPTFIASKLAANGFATLAFEITGHGFGPGGVVQIGSGGSTTTVATPGRGVDLGGPIGPTQGCIIPGPLAVRDCTRQTAVDLFALVRTIHATNGLGLGINPYRIYYVGQSFGSLYGTLFHAVEPSTRAAVLNVGGGTGVMTSRLAPSARPLAFLYLGGNNPPLLNCVPPLNAPPEPYFHDLFNDNYVFRDSPPVVNNVPGAVPIQVAFEIAEWLDMNGDALAFAPKLKQSLLGIIPTKSTLVQFAFGDLEMPNPTSSALIRAGGLEATSWYYRFDRAAMLHPELLGILLPGTVFPTMPHTFLSNPTIFDADKGAENAVAMAAQQQVAAYFATDGFLNPDPNKFLGGVFANKTLFEIPKTLPEQLNFIQIKP